jgi:hypothetical protein
MGRSGGAEAVRLMTIRRLRSAGTQSVIPGNEGSRQMGAYVLGLTRFLASARNDAPVAMRSSLRPSG